MSCSHDGYHEIRTAYDRASGELVFFWTCNSCGERLSEARRERYRPAFEPHAGDPRVRPGTAS